MADIFVKHHKKFECLSLFNKKDERNYTTVWYVKIDTRYASRSMLCQNLLWYQKHFTHRVNFGRKKDGVLVCVLQDTLGQQTHAVEINLTLSLIYDCMEECAFDLNKHN